MRKVGMAVVLLATGLVLPALSSSSAQADGAGVGSPWVVSLGDSYISGEGGRWAGNSNNSSSSVDAGGAAAYFDNATHTAETINRCHRSTAAEIYIGGGVNSLNLACSGAKTATFTSSDGYFKPGIDFYSNGANQGQALMLQNFAATHNVTMIQLSIGGNNYGFADIIQRCVTNFLTSPSWWPNYCNDDSAVTANFTTANITAQTNAILGAINNIKTAMANAGYSAGQYTIVQQTYPSPVPNGSAFRYSQSHGAGEDQQLGQERSRHGRREGARPGGCVQRSPSVREHGEPDGEQWQGQLDGCRRCRQHRVDRADPHAQHCVRPVLRAGEPAPELVG